MVKNNSIARIALVTIGLLLIPFLAMQFTDQVNWNLTDFSVMGILIFATGMAYELITRKFNTHKLAIGLFLLIIFFLIWAELAVGLLGTPFGGS